MALIPCPNCGKEISDRAAKCPACGFEIPKIKQQNRCEECGEELPEGAAECPVCGCPVAFAEENVPQRVSVANVELKRMSPKVKKTVIAVLLLIAIGIGAVIGINKIGKSNASAAYQKELSTAVSSIYSGGLQAESACSLIHDVWYNTIYEKDSYTTDKYTKIGNTFNKDFNTSLMFLFWDDDFSNRIDRIKSNQSTVEEKMKNLQSPPEEHKAAHAALMNLYDAYIELSNMAIDPSGNLNSYTSGYNAADAAFAKYYKAIQIYVN